MAGEYRIELDIRTSFHKKKDWCVLATATAQRCVRDEHRGGSAPQSVAGHGTGRSALLSILASACVLLTAEIGFGTGVTNSPLICVDNASTGTVAWLSATNAEISNGLYATNVLTANTISHYLVATNFGFNLPSNAVISGIMASVLRKSSGNMTTDRSIKIVKGGMIIGTEKSAGATWPTTAASATFGSATDLWGTVWSLADITNNNFGFAIAGTASKARVLSIDYMNLAVYYVLATPPAIDDGNGATGVGVTNAWLQGNLTSTGGAPTAVTIFWGLTDATTNKASWGGTNAAGVLPTGIFSNKVTGLAPNATYYYRCYASNGFADCWAPAASNFTTLATNPVVDNATGAAGVTGTNAWLRGTLTSTGGLPTTVTIYWGLTNWGTTNTGWANTNAMGVLPTGLFSNQVNGLTPVTKYYYRCYATNTVGGAWAASTTNFTTTAAPRPLTMTEGQRESVARMRGCAALSPILAALRPP